MIGRGIRGIVGTTFVIGLGLLAIVSEKIVSEKGPEVITEPAMTIFRNFQPLGDAIETRMVDLRNRLVPVEVSPADAIQNTSAESNPGAEAEVRVEPAEPTVGDAGDELAKATGTDQAEIAQVVPLMGVCAADTGAADVVVLGDRLALRFFERSALAAGPVGGAAPASQSIVFERLDLSGSYEVNSSGVVSLPAIGHVDVIGRDLSCAETLVARAASERLRLNASVNASFAARPPVLVRGMVRAPGAHAYSPGLTVERVLAQAGAIDMTQPLSALQLVNLRSREEELSALSASLVIERARIEAALDGDENFGTDSGAWAPVAEALGPDRFNSERELLLSELAAEAAEGQRIADRIDDLVLRVAAAQVSLDTAEEQLRFVEERHTKLQDILERGNTNENKVAAATMREMDMHRIVLEKRDALMRLEGDLRMARHEMILRETARRRALALAVHDTAKQSGSVREQLRAVRAQISLQDLEDSSVFVVTIERLDPTGTTRFTADSNTTVRPGDMVIVDMPSKQSPEAIETPVADHDFSQIDTLREVNWK